MGTMSTMTDKTGVAGKSMWPLVGQTPALFATFEFETGPSAPDRPGVFILWRQVEGRAQPIFVGDGESVVNAVATVRAIDAELDREAQGTYWLAMPFVAERTRIVRELVSTFAPVHNIEREPAPRPTMITLPAVKLPNLPATADLPTTIAARKATLESEIAQLVSRY